MDVALLLLLPLVGGYLFSRTWNYTRFKAAREDGHRLYFRAAFYSVFLFALSLLLRIWLIATWPDYRSVEAQLQEILSQLVKDADKSNPIPLAITCTLAMFLSVPVAAVLNIPFWKGWTLRRAVADDDFESVLHDATRRALPVALTMDNRKIYVGFVLRTFDPAQTRKTVAILPLISGYRDQTNGGVVFTTNYQNIYGSLSPDATLPPPLDHLAVRDFELVLPVDKIHSLARFDLRAYNQFNKPGEPVKQYNDPGNSEAPIAVR